jgi:AmmeMemoRadiSam system protein A
MTPENPGKTLLSIARAAISKAFNQPHASVVKDALWLQEKGATFVTLTQHQRLRGCIGTLEAHRPLLLDVETNAFAAAFRDPRFAPLTQAEMGDTQIEVSLLSAMQPLQFSDESDVLSQLRPGVDGIAFEFGGYRSTFLPQVWESLPDAVTFMARLKEKAGLHAEFWDEKTRLYRYTVSKWKESDMQEAEVAG